MGKAKIKNERSPVNVKKILKEKNNLIETTKEYLSDKKYKIKLDDLVNQKLREVILLLNNEKFLLHGESNSERFSKQFKLYEDVVKDVQSIISCIAYWGDNKHYHQMINKILARISDNLKPQDPQLRLKTTLLFHVFLLQKFNPLTSFMEPFLFQSPLGEQL
jgi:hypothetical protein